jgi:hypothetical protein
VLNNNRWEGMWPADGDGDHGPVPPEAVGDDGHRGREAAALATLVVVLAALWAAVFFSSTRVWGEYRSPAVELQDPPPRPTILVPRLSVDEAWEIIEGAVSQGVGDHEGP